jgi:hypothetical protein
MTDYADARAAVEHLARSAMANVEDDPQRLPAVARVAGLLGSEALAADIVADVRKAAVRMSQPNRAPLPEAVWALAESLAMIERALVPDDEERRADLRYL